jgi:hypothetical protein
VSYVCDVVATYCIATRGRYSWGRGSRHSSRGCRVFGFRFSVRRGVVREAGGSDFYGDGHRPDDDTPERELTPRPSRPNVALGCWVWYTLS